MDLISVQFPTPLLVTAATWKKRKGIKTGLEEVKQNNQTCI